MERNCRSQSTDRNLKLFWAACRLAEGNVPVSEARDAFGRATQLSAEMAAREKLVFGLCQIQGVEAGTFLERTGYSLRELMGECLDHYMSAGLLDWDESRLRLTRDGVLVSDSLWPPLLQTSPVRWTGAGNEPS